MDGLAGQKDAVIFDKDETLTTVGSGKSTSREPGLDRALRDLVKAGRKLFVVSATDRPEPGISAESWIVEEKARKCTQLEEAGLSPSLFQDIVVVIPAPDFSVSTSEPGAWIAEYARAKKIAMDRIIQVHGLDPSRVLSVGDREDIEGVASQQLKIPFVNVPSACGIQPTDTLQWILSTMVMGKTPELPGERQEYDEMKVVHDPLLAQTFVQFHSMFKEYVESRLWFLLNKLRLPQPEISAPDYNRYPGTLESAWEAARKLRGDYGAVIGIARKGLWLSFVFTLAEANTFEIYLARNGSQRITCPVSPLFKKDVEGRRVLLLDNDALTGRSLQSLAKHFLAAGAASVDALLINRYTEPDSFGRYDFSIHQDKYLDVPRVVGYRESGQAVLDSMVQLRQVREIRKVMFLDRDFKRRAEQPATMRAIQKRLVA
ncbi:Uncharacterised protein [Candidatus Bilamarchaeum dharawalense]|uniref:Uncharacterized protein n=1 Tax=Candidatus Bilamarchaeum dharawalense TaxID=2885759 RepID=A0A5E4LM03_9ARCH|nr:Uncharacterised protein [Candidatus Bilamarchaeum dharawalense]